jgi:hypothetical protein
MVTVHVPVPVQAPLHPVKVEPDAAVAVSVTVVPSSNDAEHVAPHVIPGGELDTDPEPEPAVVTASVSATSANVAFRVWSLFIGTVHVPVPLQAPLQPVNVEPAAAVAVSVTTAPSLNDAEHVAPQSIPVGVLVTEPDPPPLLVAVSVCVTTANVAVTAWSLVIVTVHEPLPVQGPLHPVKVDPDAGVAARVTFAPSS